MNHIGTPLKVPELNLSPEPEGGIELSKDMQQCLSLLTGYWQNKRLLLKASPTGILFVTSPQLEDIFHVPATEDNFVYQGDDLKCTEIMVMGHPNNAGNVWARSKVAATVNNAWPLGAKESMGFTITNLSMLHILIPIVGEKAIIAYTM